MNLKLKARTDRWLFFQVMEQVFAGRMVNDGHGVRNLQVDLFGIRRNAVHFANEMEQVEAHQGTVNEHLVGAIGIFASPDRVMSCLAD